MSKVIQISEAESDAKRKERKDDFWKSQDTIIDGAKHLATLISLLQGLLIAAIAFGNIQELLRGLALFSFVFSLVLLTMSLISSALVFMPQNFDADEGGTEFVKYVLKKIALYRTSWLSRGYILFMFASVTVMATLMFLVFQPSKSSEPVKIIIISPTPISTSTPAPTANLSTETLTPIVFPTVSATATP